MSSLATEQDPNVSVKQTPVLTSTRNSQNQQNSRGNCDASQNEISVSPEVTKAERGDADDPEVRLLHKPHAVSRGSGPPAAPQNTGQSSTSPSSAAKHHRTGHVGDGKIFKREKSSGNLQPGSIACQTKFLVLQFLHESMSESNLLHLSQSSFSNTSESEPRCMSYAERLKQQWQSKSSQSPSPAFHAGHSKPKCKVKVRSSRPPRDLREGDYFKDAPQQSKPSRSRRRCSSRTAGRTEDSESCTKSGQGAFQTCDRDSLIRSVSEIHDSSDHGTYLSDADDELDGSFDSSQQGSVTSSCFRERLAQYHQQHRFRKLTRQTGQTDCAACESSGFGDNRTPPHNVDNDSASSILSLDMINIEQEPVSPTAQFARVNDYLIQMSQTAMEQVFREDSATVDATDLDLQYLEAAAEELNVRQSISQSGSDVDKRQLSDDMEGGSGASDESEGNDDQAEDLESACAGPNPDGNDDEDVRADRSARADGSQLKLDVADCQDSTLLIDAVHSLQQDIEQEMSSLESEFEEALSYIHSDHCRSCTPRNLSRSRSLTPEAAEAVRMLARIGDEVQQRHCQDLDRAVSKLLLANCTGFFTYENFREAAPVTLDGEVDKWKQVATLLLYSQRVALHLSRLGRQNLNRIVDYTARMLVDSAADFIIRQGGWAPMFEAGSTTPSSPDHPAPVLNPFLGPFSLPVTDNPHAHSQPPDSAVPSNEPAPNIPQGQAVSESISQAEVCRGAEVTQSHILTETASETTNHSTDDSGDGTMRRTMKSDLAAIQEDPELQLDCVDDEESRVLPLNSSASSHFPQEGVEPLPLDSLTTHRTQTLLPNSSVPDHEAQQRTDVLSFASSASNCFVQDKIHALPHKLSGNGHNTQEGDVHALSSSVLHGGTRGELDAFPGPTVEKPRKEETERDRERREIRLEEEERGEGERIAPDVSRSVGVVNSRLLTRCAAVSIGVLAVGAAVVFKYARGF